MRLPTTATIWIAVVTAVFWAGATLLGLNEAAAVAMGFIPERLNGAVVLGPAVPAFLTPLSATRVHAVSLHIGFNLQILVMCGKQLDR